MFKTFNQIPEYIRQHPAITLHTISHQSREYMYAISVLETYLEKTEIQWWSLPRLYDALRDGGTLRKYKFRYTFLPFLSVILDVFRRESNQHYMCDADINNWCDRNPRKYAVSENSEHSALPVTYYEVVIEPWRSILQ
jgi:hypothetical protein